MNLPQEPKYRLQHLIDFLSLYNHIVGELPRELKVSLEFHDWYIKEVAGTAKRLGVPHSNIKEAKFDEILMVTNDKNKESKPTPSSI